ncbi:Multihaem_cytochrome [Hexamita inflata]|uniref:Multihaem cytochrome n=1 Tax=Hexamita inflata TaxID=28002 RepID=A0AA86R3A8_9EUKA|nr:Multihaem cytochrome [Hexamita inflata]CAI9961370.1 Multihaem cytochrome [Hexamita inflata]
MSCYSCHKYLSEKYALQCKQCHQIQTFCGKCQWCNTCGDMSTNMNNSDCEQNTYNSNKNQNRAIEKVLFIVKGLKPNQAKEAIEMIENKFKNTQGIALNDVKLFQNTVKKGKDNSPTQTIVNIQERQQHKHNVYEQQSQSINLKNNQLECNIIIDLQQMPAGSAKQLKSKLIPRVKGCKVKIMENGDLSINCNQGQVEPVESLLSLITINSIALIWLLISIL